MCNIETIEAEWALDSKIDLTDLDNTTKKTIDLHQKYFKYYNFTKASLRIMKGARDKLVLLKTDYFLGQLDKGTLDEHGWRPNKRLILKGDLPMHLAADDEIIEMNLEVAKLEDTIFFLENIINKQINTRQFHIKNILENRKFLNGGY